MYQALGTESRPVATLLCTMYVEKENDSRLGLREHGLPCLDCERVARGGGGLFCRRPALGPAVKAVACLLLVTSIACNCRQESISRSECFAEVLIPARS